MQNYKFIFYVIFFMAVVNLQADVYHYKNILVGDRAATMGGAYAGVSDDASGVFYNPAGIVYSLNNSVSGSANTFYFQKTTYERALLSHNWSRESTELLPNFFGLVKKFDNHAIGVSFVTTDSSVEHQDQIFTNLGNVTTANNTATTLDRFAMNLHTSDYSNLLGATYSYKFSDSFSTGITLYYSYRKYREQRHQHLEYGDGTTEFIYGMGDKTEEGFLPKAGLMFTPIKPFSIGIVVSRNYIHNSLFTTQANIKSVTSSTSTFAENSNRNKREMPYQITAGIGYFPTPYTMISSDLDYFYETESGGNDNVLNASVGIEHFLNEQYALRGGLFTNYTNQGQPSSNTYAPTEHLNLYGTSFGFAICSPTSTITFGAIYSFGSGESQIHSSSNKITNLNRYSFSGLISASSGF